MCRYANMQMCKFAYRSAIICTFAYLHIFTLLVFYRPYQLPVPSVCAAFIQGR
jgi:hypothetical protein